VLEHVCNSELSRAAIGLYKTVLEGDFKRTLQRSEHYSEHAEEMPFFSQAFLYPLLGKDSARTVLSQVSRVIGAAGLDVVEIERRAWLELVESKVRVTYDSSADLLVLRQPGRVEKTKDENGASVLYGERRTILGMQIPKASTFELSDVPDVLWLKDAFQMWRAGSLKAQKPASPVVVAAPGVTRRPGKRKRASTK
jgi:hypothetical protein